MTSDVKYLETYKNIKPLNLQALVSYRRLVPQQAKLRLHWSLSLAFRTVPDVGVFVATVALCTLIKNRYCESKSPAWLGQTFPSLKGFVSATWGSEMKIGYKTRKGMFFPRPLKNLCNFLDPRHSTLDPRQKPTLKSHMPSSRRVSESFSFTFYF